MWGSTAQNRELFYAALHLIFTFLVKKSNKKRKNDKILYPHNLKVVSSNLAPATNFPLF